MSCPPLPAGPRAVETQRLLCRGGYELLRLDHSGGPPDLLHQLFLRPGFYEELLHAFIADPQVHVTAPAWFDGRDATRYQSQVQQLRALTPPFQQSSADHGYREWVFFGGMDLGLEGGHYAVFVVNAYCVLLFDSMVSGAADGAFTTFFRQVAHDVWPGKTVHVDHPAPGEAAPQPTGGFGHLPPSFHRELDEDPATEAWRTEERAIIYQYNVESQDHFCYLWALLYVQCRYRGWRVPVTRLPRRRGRTPATDPLPNLLAIKRYGWCLLAAYQRTGEYPAARLPDYFAFWDAPADRADYASYRRYLLPRPAPPPSLDDCIMVAWDIPRTEMRAVPRLVAPAGCLTECPVAEAR